MKSDLANYLVHQNLLTMAEACQADEQAQAKQTLLISYLVKENLISADLLLQHFVASFQLPVFQLAEYDQAWLKLGIIPLEYIRQFHVLPMQLTTNAFSICLSDPTHKSIIDTITFLTGMRLQVYLVSESELLTFLHEQLGENNQNHLAMPILEKMPIALPHTQIENNQTEEPIIKFFDNLMQHAITKKATDVHIECYDTFCRIRYRLDGILHVIAQLTHQIAKRLILRCKVLANLDIAESRMPQDGRFYYQKNDVRINVCPTLAGEKIVLRLLTPIEKLLQIDQLFIYDQQKHLFLRYIKASQGLILICGPTGSGKTATLYAALHYLNEIEKNISTVEDPVEIKLAGINQIPIQPKIGLTFAKALRALLRQDPDILMIGEIRDNETAHIATQAALTGHLVLSTLHCNNTSEALSRLQAMEVPVYHLAHAITLLIAQRLLRKLCSLCKQPDSQGYQAVGCKACFQGYQGRIALYEFLPITLEVKETIAKQQNFLNLLSSSDTLLQTAESYWRQGLTSQQEIQRVLAW